MNNSGNSVGCASVPQPPHLHPFRLAEKLHVAASLRRLQSMWDLAPALRHAAKPLRALNKPGVGRSPP
eukprot:6464702-Heterocapsa_arctica.AAC.1